MGDDARMAISEFMEAKRHLEQAEEEKAQAEGWIDKSGSKWKTMPGLMRRYRVEDSAVLSMDSSATTANTRARRHTCTHPGGFCSANSTGQARLRASAS